MINVLKSVLTRIENGRRIIQSIRYGNSDTVEFVDGSTFGIDSNVPKDTPLLSVKTDKGSYVIGAITNHKGAAYGETWIYATDSNGSRVETILKLRNDGTMELNGDTDYAVKYSKLETAFNQLRDDFNALVLKYNSHIHAGTVAGFPVVISSTASIGTTSTADITPAKSNKVKLS